MPSTLNPTRTDYAEHEPALAACSNDAVSHLGTYCLAGAWFVGTIFAFWLFLASDYRSFYTSSAQQLAIFEKTNFSYTLEAYVKTHPIQSDVQPSAYVFHFWNPSCQCDRFNRPHVEKLIQLYGPQGVHFFIVPKTGTTQSAQRWHQSLGHFKSYVSVVNLTSTVMALNTNLIPAGPAAAVLDRSGELAYFGPYSLGGVCQADDNGLIENALTKLMSHSKPLQTYASGFGCFCSWQ